MRAPQKNSEKLGFSGISSEKGHLAGLTPHQAMAYRDLYRFATGETEAGMAVLRGAAGTGKTYLMAHLINALAGSGLTVAIAAPTNKAVRVLRETIVANGAEVPDVPIDQRFGQQQMSWIAFGSIQSLLGLKVTERDDGSQECIPNPRSAPSLHEYDLAIVDECSMISADLFARIITAKRSCRVLFVGDPAQLPPISATEALSPTFTRVTFEVTLNEVVRQARENPIIRLSMRLREAIERGERISNQAIIDALPPAAESPAALLPGGPETVVQCVLHEIRSGRDARAIAFTNAAVQHYNRTLHAALHGLTPLPFVPGERVIVHSACEANLIETEWPAKVNLITSEELTVRAIHRASRPQFETIPCARLVLERESGNKVEAYVALDAQQLEAEVSALFAKSRALKTKVEYGQANADFTLMESKAMSAQAWALKKAFAPLRHAYAITAHKSQGSTFDTAIVDLRDMAKMRSAFAFNRGLYVAITRPRAFLGIVA